jgi:hypothetical protein
MIPLRLELRTACVLDRSDNQLHHRTNLMGEMLSRGNMNTSITVSQQCRSRWWTAHGKQVAISLSIGKKQSIESQGILRIAVAGEVSAVLTHPSDYSPLLLPTLGERYTLMMESSNGYNMNGCCSRDMAFGGASDRMTLVVTGTSRSPQEELEQAAWRQRKLFLKAQADVPKLLHGRPLSMRIEKIER